MLVRRWTVLVGVLGGLVYGAVSLTGGGASPRQRLSSAVLDKVTPAPRLVIALEPWRLHAAVSRAAIAVNPLGNIEILGGLQSGDSSTAAVWTLDPRNGQISSAGSLTLAVHDAAGAWLAGRAFVFAGGAATTEALVQEVSGGTSRETGVLPVPRSDLAAATAGGTTYVIGGFDGQQLVPSILATTDGVHFKTVGTLIQAVRYPGVAVLGGKVFIIGGELSTTEGTLSGPQTSDIQRFDPATGATTLVGHLPTALGHEMAFPMAGSLYVLGGRVGAALTSTIWRIDPLTGAATTAGRFAYPRSDAGVAVTASGVFLIGGESTGPLAPLTTVVRVRALPD